MSNTFSKNNKLKSRKRITTLFEDGNSTFVYPFKLVFIISPSTNPTFKAAVSVSKRKFKKAVDRNRIKRQMRELIRLNHHSFDFITQNNLNFEFMLIYVAEDFIAYSKMEKAYIRLMKKLKNEIPT